jgi:hypothetical protein
MSCFATACLGRNAALATIRALVLGPCSSRQLAWNPSDRLLKFAARGELG